MDIQKAISDRRLPMKNWDKIMYWLTPTFIISCALYFLYLLTYTNWFENSHGINPTISKTTEYCLFLLLLSIGLYSIYKISNFQKLTSVITNLDTKDKKRILETLTTLLPWRLENDSNENCYKFFHKKGLLSLAYRITILTDMNGFYLNVQDFYDWAPIDFGANKRLTNKIKSEIEKLIKQYDKKASL
jgi:hypothetical protein